MTETENGGSEPRAQQARRLEQIADEARRLADHARVAAGHFRSVEIARAGAHALALEGHLINIRRLLDETAVQHASRSNAQP
jgi:hypothetical protein